MITSFMERYTYLLINLFTIIIPLARSFETRIYFYSKWKFCFIAIAVTGLAFLLWDYYKTLYGVWGFNDKYCVGLKIGGLPVEEILFFFTVPYACIFIYEAIGYFIDKRLEDSLLIRYITWVGGATMFIMSFFVTNKAYTFTVLLIGGVVTPACTFLLKGNSLNKFFISFVISLVPMLVVNGLLTALPVVIYNNNQNLNLRIGTIPVEDFIYAEVLLILNVAIYQWGKDGYLWSFP